MNTDLICDQESCDKYNADCSGNCECIDVNYIDRCKDYKPEESKLKYVEIIWPETSESKPCFTAMNHEKYTFVGYKFEDEERLYFQTSRYRGWSGGISMLSGDIKSLESGSTTIVHATHAVFMKKEV